MRTDPRVTRDLLLLVGIKVTLKEIRTWPRVYVTLAESYAAKVHEIASDNPGRYPVMPEFLKRYKRVTL